MCIMIVKKIYKTVMIASDWIMDVKFYLKKLMITLWSTIKILNTYFTENLQPLLMWNFVQSIWKWEKVWLVGKHWVNVFMAWGRRENNQIKPENSCWRVKWLNSFFHDNITLAKENKPFSKVDFGHFVWIIKVLKGLWM